MTIYTKEIGGRVVFSSCKTIQMPNGSWISNPSEEQIEKSGWVVYVPPVVPSSPQTEPGYNDVMEAVKMMLSSSTEELSDDDALSVAALFPTWSSKIGLEVSAGERLWYDLRLWKVLQSHTVQSDWTPDITPALFKVVSVDEWPEIPENIPSTDPWMAGRKGTWKGEHYICKMDNCVWNPDVYPQAWEKQ